MQFSESQQQDMLHLRRCFYGKVGQLARARAAIMDQMPAAVQPSLALSPDLNSKCSAKQFGETKEWADQLCANQAEQNQAYLFCTICLGRGVSLLM